MPAFRYIRGCNRVSSKLLRLTVRRIIESVQIVVHCMERKETPNQRRDESSRNKNVSDHWWYVLRTQLIPHAISTINWQHRTYAVESCDRWNDGTHLIKMLPTAIRWLCGWAQRSDSKEFDGDSVRMTQNKIHSHNNEWSRAPELKLNCSRNIIELNKSMENKLQVPRNTATCDDSRVSTRLDPMQHTHVCISKGNVV